MLGVFAMISEILSRYKNKQTYDEVPEGYWNDLEGYLAKRLLVKEEDKSHDDFRAEDFMMALHRYLLKEMELFNYDYDTPEHDGILEALDDLWWDMSDEERRVRNNMCKEKWIRVRNGIVCPHCIYLVENFMGVSPPSRCDRCMTDIISKEFVSIRDPDPDPLV